MKARQVPRWAIAYGLAALALVAGAAALRPPRAPLQEVYSPGFASVPAPAPPAATARVLVDELRSPRGQRFLDAIAPSEAGALWLALVVALVVGVDFRWPRSPRHLDLLLLWLLGAALFHALDLLERMPHPAFVRLLDLVFWTVFLVNAALLVRALYRARVPLERPWVPGLARRPLMALALALLTLDLVIGLVRPPDDAGYFVNLGAQRLRERGRLPYGDPLLDGTPGAAYAPLAYIVHVPFQWLVDPWVPNASSPDRPELGGRSAYLVPSALATQACTIAFHLAGVVALWVAARRMAGEHVAWGLVALYASSVAVLGVGGSGVDQVTGMSFFSHLGPASATLVACALVERPGHAGVALGIAAGLGFYPAFMAPAWLGHYWGDRRKLTAFLIGLVATGVALLAIVLLFSRAAPGRTVFGTFLWDTLGHHTDPLGYGRSPFGFWGQKGPVRTWLAHPLVAGNGATAPAFLALFALCAGTFFVTRRRGEAALYLASAAVAIGAALVKIHATGTYLAWFYPLLLLGHFAWPPGSDRAPLAA